MDFYKNLYAKSISIFRIQVIWKILLVLIFLGVSSEENMMLIKCPDFLEIKTVLFINGNSAPDPNDFAVFFIILVETLLGQMFAMLFNSFLNKIGFSLE